MPNLPAAAHARLTRRHFLAAAGACAAAPGAAPAWAAPAWAAPAATDTLTMQAAYINDAEFLGYFVALQNGYYRDAGLDVRYLPGGPDIIPESALLAGTADLALTELDTTIQAITRQGAPLRIVGTQFQKNPLGIISLQSNPVRTPADLAGKTLSVSAVSMAMVHSFLKANGLGHSGVRIVPDSQADPTALLTGAVDAACGFVTDFPYAVKLHGQTPVSMLIADFGLPLFNDTVVVTVSALSSKRAAIVRWLAASRRGWDENFRNPAKYPVLFHDSWLKPSGRPVGYDVFSNTAFMPLMQSPGGIFAMDEASIGRNIAVLAKLGVHARRDMFDTTLLAEIR